jgi:hypothetical protein
LLTSDGIARSENPNHVDKEPPVTVVVIVKAPPVTSVHPPLEPTRYCNLKFLGPVDDAPCNEERVIELAPVVLTSACQNFESAPLSHPSVETEYGLGEPVVPEGPLG